VRADRVGTTLLRSSQSARTEMSTGASPLAVAISGGTARDRTGLERRGQTISMCAVTPTRATSIQPLLAA
jgi:hypothetical protein